MRSGREAGTVGGGVDAARQPGDDGEAGFAKLARDPLGKLHPGARRIARADDRHHRQCQRRRMAADREHGRRVIDHLQAERIIGLAQRHERNAELFRGGELAFGVRPRANLRGPVGAAAAGEGGRFDRGAGAAKMIDQRCETCADPAFASKLIAQLREMPRGPTLWLRMRRSQSRRCSALRPTLCRFSSNWRPTRTAT